MDHRQKVPCQWQEQHLHWCDGHQCEYLQSPSREHPIVHVKQVANNSQFQYQTQLKINENL